MFHSFQVLHSRVGSWPHPQTLDWAFEAEDKHSCLLRTILNYDHIKFNKIDTLSQCYKTFYGLYGKVAYFELSSHQISEPK